MIGGFLKPSLFQIRLLTLLSFIQNEVDQINADSEKEKPGRFLGAPLSRNHRTRFALCVTVTAAVSNRTR